MAQECFHSMGKFWKKPGILFKVKKMIYRGLVENTLLSGLESEVLTHNEYEKLEKWNVLHMRKVLGSDNSEEVNGVRRQKSNSEIRKLFGTHTLISIMRKRRLDWLRNIVRYPDENKQLMSMCIH